MLENVKSVSNENVEIAVDLLKEINLALAEGEKAARRLYPKLVEVGLIRSDGQPAKGLTESDKALIKRFIGVSRVVAKEVVIKKATVKRESLTVSDMMSVVCKLTGGKLPDPKRVLELVNNITPAEEVRFKQYIQTINSMMNTKGAVEYCEL